MISFLSKSKNNIPMVLFEQSGYPRDTVLMVDEKVTDCHSLLVWGSRFQVSIWDGEFTLQDEKTVSILSIPKFHHQFLISTLENFKDCLLSALRWQSLRFCCQAPTLAQAISPAAFSAYPTGIPLE